MSRQHSENLGDLQFLVWKLRKEALTACYKAGSGHPGSAMSVMDALVALYFGGILRYDPKNPTWEERDFFLLSNGHACPALYAVLAEAGYFNKRELAGLRKIGRRAQGHPHRGSLPGIEISSGSLGQGLSVGLGLALDLKRKNKQNKVVIMMSDGEQEEGSTWEAVMYAPKHKLENLLAIVDKNRFQIDGSTAEIMPHLDPLAEKYQAFGWEVEEVNGHDMEKVMNVLRKERTSGKPRVIISNTVRGKWVSFIEGSEHWHAGKISEEEYKQALEEISARGEEV